MSESRDPQSERAESFERELRRLVPPPPSQACDAAVARALWPAAAPMSLADRLLAGTLMTGAAAACIVIALLTVDIVSRTTTPDPPSMAGSTPAPTPAEAQRRLAQLAESLDLRF